MTDIVLGCIKTNSNPHSPDRFVFEKSPCARCATDKRDIVYTNASVKPINYCLLVENANMMKDNKELILVDEPFLLDDELKLRAEKWVRDQNREAKRKKHR